EAHRYEEARAPEVREDGRRTVDSGGAQRREGRARVRAGLSQTALTRRRQGRDRLKVESNSHSSSVPGFWIAVYSSIVVTSGSRWTYRQNGRLSPGSRLFDG